MTVLKWTVDREFHFIEPGKPTQNAYIESFHGKFRAECLNQNWFLSLNDARRIIQEWRIDYNTARPHSSLGYQTPIEFAARLAPPPRQSYARSTPWSQTEALDNQRTTLRPD
jgi:transposase InsO family protein